MLKQARDMYSLSEYRDVNLMGQRLKKTLEDALDTQCIKQKKIKGVNVTNVFVGFRLIE
jgi:hypothetical protein